ncbi:MAG: zf-HC2 domain-containing protein [Chloroflexota bacterium]
MTFRRNHVNELISASLTGDLTDVERLELNAHLVRCETCRATLAAFTAERRILSGMPVAEPPRDLSARVRSGIESGRKGSPWWRRPNGLIGVGATLGTVAAAVLTVVIIGKLNFAPVGNASNSPSASVSLAPGPSAVETSPASAAPTPIPAFALGPGELGYLSLTGAPLEALRLSFINDATGDTIDAGSPSGPPIAAALSPNGQWLAYITQKGETGAREVWVLNLTAGGVTHLGCSSAAPFTDRLAWSPDSQYLAFTLVGVDIGPEQGCEAASNGTDVWMFDTTRGKRTQFTTAGNAFAADFGPAGQSGDAQLWVSFAMPEPQSALLSLAGSGAGREASEQAPGVFLPLLSPDGNRAIFWNGTMTSNGGSWHFSLGGMPQLSGDFRAAGPASSWVGTPLFADLTPAGGEAFASGNFIWGPDNDQLAFWDGAWTGVPQSSDGRYPNQQDVYFGKVSGGLLNVDSRLVLDLPEGPWIVSVTISDAAFSEETPGGAEAAITIGLPSAGIGDPPSAYLQIVPLGSGRPRTIGGGVEPPPWDGPAVYGY